MYRSIQPIAAEREDGIEASFSPEETQKVLVRLQAIHKASDYLCERLATGPTAEDRKLPLTWQKRLLLEWIIDMIHSIGRMDGLEVKIHYGYDLRAQRAPWTLAVVTTLKVNGKALRTERLAFRSPESMLGWLSHLAMGALAVHSGMFLDATPDSQDSDHGRR